MKLKPLQDRVIVKQSEAEEKTKSGILLPDTAKCLARAGIPKAVKHRALDDAQDVCRLIRHHVNSAVFASAAVTSLLGGGTN